MPTKPLLIFDLGNVILRHDNAYWMDRLSQACRDPAKGRAIIESYVASLSDERGEGTVRDFFETARQNLGFAGDYDAFAEIWCCHFTRDAAMEALVERLAGTYRVVILSNTNDAHWDYLMREYPILQTVAVCYTSFELGMRKPDPAIYRHVLDAEGYQAGDAIFIDDRIENVDAARSLGMHAIHFIDQAGLEAALKTLKIEF